MRDGARARPGEMRKASDTAFGLLLCTICLPRACSERRLLSAASLPDPELIAASLPDAELIRLISRPGVNPLQHNVDINQRATEADMRRLFSPDEMDLISVHDALRSEDEPTALMLAAALGHRTAVSVLLNLSANVDLEILANNSHAGYTALMVAACQGHAAIAADLIAAGAAVNHPPSLGCAVLNGHAAAVRVLLMAGAESPLIVHELAARRPPNALEILRLLLEAGADLTETDGEGDTALIATAFSGSAEITGALIAAGAEVNSGNGAALKSAAMHGDVSTVKVLLEGGAHVDPPPPIGDSRSVLGLGNPLFRAASEGHVETARLLLHVGAKVDARGLRQRTALIVASMGGHTAMVKLLLGAGADPDAVDEDGDTAIHLTIFNKFKLTVEGKLQDYSIYPTLVLLFTAGANTNVRGVDDMTPLMLVAAEAQDNGLINLLIEFHADVNVKTAKGMTALMIAAQHGYVMGVAILIKHGADVNALDILGYNALMHAAAAMATLDAGYSMRKYDQRLKDPMQEYNFTIEHLLTAGTSRPPPVFMEMLRQRHQTTGVEIAFELLKLDSVFVRHGITIFLITMTLCALALAYKLSQHAKGARTRCTTPKAVNKEKQTNNQAKKPQQRNMQSSSSRQQNSDPLLRRRPVPVTTPSKPTHSKQGNNRVQPQQPALPRGSTTTAIVSRAPNADALDRPLRHSRVQGPSPQEAAHTEAAPAAPPLSAANDVISLPDVGEVHLPPEVVAEVVSRDNEDDTPRQALITATPITAEATDVFKDDACCVVCMDQPRTHIFGPCGHHCVCSDCGEAIMNTAARSCPICRECAHVFMKVFSISD